MDAVFELHPNIVIDENVVKKIVMPDLNITMMTSNTSLTGYLDMNAVSALVPYDYIDIVAPKRKNARKIKINSDPWKLTTIIYSGISRGIITKKTNGFKNCITFFITSKKGKGFLCVKLSPSSFHVTGTRSASQILKTFDIVNKRIQWINNLIAWKEEHIDECCDALSELSCILYERWMDIENYQDEYNIHDLSFLDDDPCSIDSLIKFWKNRVLNFDSYDMFANDLVWFMNIKLFSMITLQMPIIVPLVNLKFHIDNIIFDLQLLRDYIRSLNLEDCFIRYDATINRGAILSIHSSSVKFNNFKPKSIENFNIIANNFSKKLNNCVPGNNKMNTFIIHKRGSVTHSGSGKKSTLKVLPFIIYILHIYGSLNVDEISKFKDPAYLLWLLNSLKSNTNVYL